MNPTSNPHAEKVFKVMNRMRKDHQENQFKKKRQFFTTEVKQQGGINQLIMKSIEQNTQEAYLELLEKSSIIFSVDETALQSIESKYIAEEDQNLLDHIVACINQLKDSKPFGKSFYLKVIDNLNFTNYLSSFDLIAHFFKISDQQSGQEMLTKFRVKLQQMEELVNLNSNEQDLKKELDLRTIRDLREKAMEYALFIQKKMND